MKIKFGFVGGVTFAFVGGYKGMAVCSEHDKRDVAIGAAVALLKVRLKFNKAMRDCIDELQRLFPRRHSSSSWLPKAIKVKKIKLTDAEVMSYCMIRAELTNRIKEASKILADYDADYNITRRRRGPDNAFIVEDCARKLVKACPNLARLGNG